MANHNGNTTAKNDIDELRDNAKHVVEQAQDKVGEIKDKVLSAKADVVTKGNDLLAQATKLIKDNPFAAVGVAFGVGYLLMRVTRIGR